MRKPVDIVVSFDTTGSMFPCLSQVKRRVNEMIDRLFREIPNLRVGIIVHGDYCDINTTYVIKTLDLTNDRHSLYRFVSEASATGGGDAPECYELVLHKARSFKWGPGSKALIVIGDDVPHEPSYPGNKDRLDWINEINLLLKMGVHVYGVQALNRPHARNFYREIARRTGGFHLTLDQFSNVVELVMAICYQQMGPNRLHQWEIEVERIGRMNRNVEDAFAILCGRSTFRSRFLKSRALEAVPPGRFQIMDVDTDQSIREFVEDNGLTFRTGRGFYQLTKTETIQDHKQVVLRENLTGDLYSGEKARQMLGLPKSGSLRSRPVVPEGYTAFVQSTSYNRKLIGGTEFLYEVDLSR